MFTCRVEHHLTVVQLRNSSEEVEGSDVPHLGAADDLETIGVEDTTEVLVQLVKLVDLSRSSVVPQHSITQDQLVCWIKCGSDDEK